MTEKTKGITFDIDNIFSLEKNSKHPGDYFLRTKNKVFFWVKDPDELFKKENAKISSFTGSMSVLTVNDKQAQVLIVDSVTFEVQQENGRPDYSKMSEDEIIKSIMNRKKAEKKKYGNEFVKFRSEVVSDQRTRHTALVKSIKKKGAATFEDVERDENYGTALQSARESLEAEIGRNELFGGVKSRMDGLPNYDINKDLTWGGPNGIN